MTTGTGHTDVLLVHDETIVRPVGVVKRKQLRFNTCNLEFRDMFHVSLI